MKKLIVFDGCAGTKSATQAFADRGHTVETLDIEGNHTYTMDIKDFHPDKKHYDFMWFSPPCTEFSLANPRKGKCKDRDPDMSIIEACFRIIDEAKPTYWIIENPQACLRHFIGKPTITIKYSDYGYICQKPTDLWGVFPWFWSRTGKNNNTVAFREAFPAHNVNRGQIPYELSYSICVSIENVLWLNDLLFY